MKLSQGESTSTEAISVGDISHVAPNYLTHTTPRKRKYEKIEAETQDEA